MADGLLLGLLAACFWGLTDIAAALAGRRFGSLPTLAFAQLVSVLVLLVVALITEGRLPIVPAAVPIAIALGLLGSVGYVAFFAALRIGPVSVVSPTVAAYGGLVVVLAVVILGETIRPAQWLGAGFATVGIVLAGFHFNESIRGTRPVSRGVLLAVVALLCFAVLIVGSSGPIRQFGWLQVTFVQRVANSAAVWLLLLVTRTIRPRGSETLLYHAEASTRSGFGIVLLVGLLDVGGLIVFAIGLQVSLAWLVGLASSFAPVVAVLVAVGFLGERLRPIQWIGLLAIVAGLVLVVLPG
jgi:drug/metabolite transporter (DMT)-like permease